MGCGRQSECGNEWALEQVTAAAFVRLSGGLSAFSTRETMKGKFTCVWFGGLTKFYCLSILDTRASCLLVAGDSGRAVISDLT